MTYLKFTAILLGGFALMAQSCGTTKVAKNLSTLTVSTAFAKSDGCSSKPPAFRIGGAPKGTKTLQFRMVDLDYTSYNHGGGRVAYAGPSVPAGAFSYAGPCPPAGTTHRYEWTVSAVDASGTIIARGKTVVPYTK